MDSAERQVRLILAEESRAEEGLIPCVSQGKRLEALERLKWMLVGAVSVLSFLGSLVGSWLSR